MTSRRTFLKNTLLLPLSVPLFSSFQLQQHQTKDSDFSKKLVPVGRILEEEDFYVWCNSPVFGSDGKVHVFYSRWPAKYGMSGWIHKSEIARAVADRPEGPFKYEETVLASRPGFFDATTCHNPHIQFVEGKYCLFYMGNSNGKTNTKRIGLATADSPEGPWQRCDKPLLEAGAPGSWDDHCTTNPAFLKHPNGENWLYYKSWNTKEYEEAAGKAIRGNRKYGLAISDQIDSGYKKYSGNPVIDFSSFGENQQLEDAYVWQEKGKFWLIARDMGFIDHKKGLIFESEDGINWSPPKIAYHEADYYIDQPPTPPHLKRYGRFERPQLLLRNEKPEYLYTTTQGGKYQTSSGFVFKIDNTN